MGILGKILLVEHLGQRMIAELKSYQPGEQVSARLLELKCEFNDAICELYAFAETDRRSFDHDHAVSRYCKSIDKLRDQFALAGATWIDRVRVLDASERRSWGNCIETGLAECIRDIRRALNTMQIAVSLEDIGPGRPALRSVD